MCFCFHSFQYIFFFSYFFSMTQVVRSVFCNCQILGFFQISVLVFSLILLWWENTLCMTWILSTFLRFILWLRMCSSLVNVPHGFEKAVFSAALGWISYQCQLVQFGRYCFSSLLELYWYSVYLFCQSEKREC